MQKKYVDYNKSNTDYAKSMRRAMTRAEKKMWFDMLQARPLGYKFLRQKMIGSFILDFYCSKLLLAIEVDGETHADQQEYDEQRTYFLSKKGIVVLRYTNTQVLEKTEAVYDDLIGQLQKERENNAC